MEYAGEVTSFRKEVWPVYVVNRARHDGRPPPGSFHLYWSDDGERIEIWPAVTSAEPELVRQIAQVALQSNTLTRLPLPRSASHDI